MTNDSWNEHLMSPSENEASLIGTEIVLVVNLAMAVGKSAPER
jgi:hypothetical protein